MSYYFSCLVSKGQGPRFVDQILIRFLWDGERAETHWGKYFLKEYFNLQEIFLQFSFLRNWPVQDKASLYNERQNEIAMNLICFGKHKFSDYYKVAWLLELVHRLLRYVPIWQKLTHENLGCIKIGMFFQKVIRLIVGKDGLRTPNEAFFFKIPNFWAGADKLGK